MKLLWRLFLGSRLDKKHGVIEFGISVDRVELLVGLVATQGLLEKLCLGVSAGEVN